MMQLACRLRLNGRKRIELGSHKREYSLLLIAKKHDRAERASSKHLDYGHLQGIDVLHLVHLYPRITLVQFSFRIGNKRIVRHHKQILEVKQSVGSLILAVLLGKRHLLQKLEYGLTVAIIARIRLSKVAILLHIIIYISHGCRIKRLTHNCTDTTHSCYVSKIDTLRMHTQFLWMSVANLMHHTLKMEYLAIRATTVVVGLHQIFVLTKIARKYRYGIILVNNARLGSHKSLGKQKLRAEPMHIAHEHVPHIIIRNVLRNAFNHAACSTVGKRKAQHILILYAL